MEWNKETIHPAADSPGDCTLHEPEIVGNPPLQQGGAPSEACPQAMTFKIHHSSLIIGLLAPPQAFTKSS